MNDYELEQAIAWLRDGCPKFPIYGVAGGTQAEERAQDEWERRYGRSPLKRIMERLPVAARKALLDYVCGPEEPTDG